MQFDFHTSVGRGPENLKQRYTPPCIVQKGYASFAGAEMDFPIAPSIMEEMKKTLENHRWGKQIPMALRNGTDGKYSRKSKRNRNNGKH